MAHQPTRFRFRSYPKAIFFYPLMLAAFVCGGLSWMRPNLEFTGVLFLFVLSINFMIVSFEFSRFVSLAVVFLITTLIFAGLWLDVIPSLKLLIATLDFAAIRASAAFYLAVGVILFLLLFGMFLATRFDYWELRPNELLHHEGFLGDLRRFPAPNLSAEKERRDVLEWLLLRSGRLILHPPGHVPIILENVPRIERVEARLQEVLSSISVSTTG
ncbi:MAG: hypothetical protein HYY96_08040 [Candidatus Tectomicrobia bacterium]|nr:hypothetical protein [Candidatus Tectomicrobia bacterium]